MFHPVIDIDVLDLSTATDPQVEAMTLPEQMLPKPTRSNSHQKWCLGQGTKLLQQFQLAVFHSPQRAQPKQVCPLLCTAIPQVVPLPFQSSNIGRPRSLRVVAPRTPVAIMESPSTL